jgi:N-acetyl sugar amidotransferase
MDEKVYRICNRCIMDTSDPFITFDEMGYCNHCTEALETMKKRWFPDENGTKYLNEIIEKIKHDGKQNEYDCIIGLSGGIDSSYLAYLAVKKGLRPLIVHVDCGWNSELAVKNIENIVKLLNLELHTHVVDWEEMKDLQIAYLKSNIANQDVPQDHAIFAALYTYAARNNVKYVFTGSNFATESILPTTWGYNALDYKSLKSIHKKFGQRKLRTFPHVTFFDRYIYYVYIKRMTVIKPLNYLNYNKEQAMKILADELGWRYYGGKHHESRFTKFFQAYYLPTKFGYDKRRAHLSSLIISGQIDRKTAIESLKSEIYQPAELDDDIEYVAKKLDMSKQKLYEIINQPNKSYKDYASNERIFDLGFKLRKKIKNY